MVPLRNWVVEEKGWAGVCTRPRPSQTSDLAICSVSLDMASGRSESNQDIPRGLVNRTGTPLGRGSRLPSVRGQRDLTLGGIQRKKFTPNLNVSKKTHGSNETLKGSSLEGPESTNEAKGALGRGRGRNERGRGKGRGEDRTIQLHSEFAHGPMGESSSGWSRGSVSGGGGGGGGGERQTGGSSTVIKASMRQRGNQDDKDFLDTLLRDDHCSPFCPVPITGHGSSLHVASTGGGWRRKPADTEVPVSKRRQQCFRKEYTEEFRVIQMGKTETCAFCEVCNSEFSIKSGGKNDIVRHIAGIKHSDRMKQESGTSKINSFFVQSSEKSKPNHDVIRAEVMLVDLITELNLPMASMDKFTRAFKTMFKDSNIAKQFQCGRSKGTAIVKEIAAKSTLHLAARMKAAPFTLSTDGSNDAGSKKLFPIIIRSFNPESHLVTSEILSIPVCEGSATGENIFSLMEAELTAHGIPWTNCLALGADNAPVMVGKGKGVYGFMSRKHPSLYMSGCVCHLIHIAAEKAAACLPLNVDQLLIDTYYYLDKSSKRLAAFKAFQVLHELKDNKILKHVSTRWLSIRRCLPRLLENWEPLLDFFKAQEKSASSSAEKEKVGKLRKIFSSPTNRLTCMFLVEALQPFDEINTELQSEAPKMHILHRRLEKLLKSLQLRFVKPTAIQGKLPAEVDFQAESNLRDDSELLLGQMASEFIARKEEVCLREERLKEFYSKVKQFYMTSIKYILEKLPYNDELLQHATILDPKQQLHAKLASLEYFLKRFPVLIPHATSVASIKLEFAQYQCLNIQSCIQERLDSTWVAIGQLREDGQIILPNLSRVMLNIMTIPHSSAHCERIFSHVRKNQTEFRSRLNNETVEALLIAKTREGQAESRDYNESELEDLKKAYFRSLQSTQ
ncbi:Zinc finger bed domain-containing protein 5 [Plakobranchus ocellatus]|uniref:Zinc finger bed domain-containing protein 5 n=1 Tax=Plakobranchus ocellatus TaxID=259542 RepID=A0AAV3Y8N3_9GAST|nr:Zinc finger bed domain-containing protein 5 [Plakobranchus ocellatus]